MVTRKLLGHVDNSRYPAITVDIELYLTTPSEAKGVPVIIEFFPSEWAARMPPQPSPSWQEQVIARGWAYAILSPTSIQADNGAGLTRGIIGLVNKGQPRKPDDWGRLRAWAWGASRALDYLATDPAVDAKRAVIEGVSRYGKASLVTMAYEPRFRHRLHRFVWYGRRRAASPPHRRAARERRPAAANTTGWPATTSNMPGRSPPTICPWTRTS